MNKKKKELKTKKKLENLKKKKKTRKFLFFNKNDS